MPWAFVFPELPIKISLLCQWIYKEFSSSSSSIMHMMRIDRQLHHRFFPRGRTVEIRPAWPSFHALGIVHSHPQPRAIWYVHAIVALLNIVDISFRCEYSESFESRVIWADKIVLRLQFWGRSDLIMCWCLYSETDKQWLLCCSLVGLFFVLWIVQTIVWS